MPNIQNLQDILDFVMRDFVESWYCSFTDDKDFLFSVRDTAQNIMINVSNRYNKNKSNLYAQFINSLYL